jgi:hypothetical protein
MGKRREARRRDGWYGKRRRNGWELVVNRRIG